jgi:Uma2 family endonuclease
MQAETRDDRSVSVADFEPGVVYHDVPWEVYKALIDDEANNHVRITYLDGTMLLMSPAHRHEEPVHLIGQVIRTVAYASQIKYRSVGSTTLWRDGGGRRKGSGKEPDTAFYLGPNVALTRGMTDLRLDTYPPPDLAVEIENTSGSELILPVYARLGVPELWIYRVKPGELWFGRWTGNAYEAVDQSVCLPALTPARVLQALDAFNLDDPDEGAWNAWLQEWARGLVGG